MTPRHLVQPQVWTYNPDPNSSGSISQNTCIDSKLEYQAITLGARMEFSSLSSTITAGVVSVNLSIFVARRDYLINYLRVVSQSEGRSTCHVTQAHGRTSGRDRPPASSKRPLFPGYHVPTTGASANIPNPMFQSSQAIAAGTNLHVGGRATTSPPASRPRRHAPRAPPTQADAGHYVPTTGHVDACLGHLPAIHGPGRLPRRRRRPLRLGQSTDPLPDGPTPTPATTC